MEKRETVSQQNLEYSSELPQTSDGPEGFAGYWMTNQELSESLALVKQALRGLESEGEVIERTMPDGRTLYSARRLN